MVAKNEICMDATFFGVIVLINFLLIDATDRSKISSNHHRILFDVSLQYLLSFSNTPFKGLVLSRDLLFKGWPVVYSIHNDRDPLNIILINNVSYCRSSSLQSFRFDNFLRCFCSRNTQVTFSINQNWV